MMQVDPCGQNVAAGPAVCGIACKIDARRAAEHEGRMDRAAGTSDVN